MQRGLLSEATPAERKRLFRSWADGYQALHRLSELVKDSGLEMPLLELVKLRASQVNGCAYCIDMHSKDARATEMADPDVKKKLLAGALVLALAMTGCSSSTDTDETDLGRADAEPTTTTAAEPETTAEPEDPCEETARLVAAEDDDASLSKCSTLADFRSGYEDATGESLTRQEAADLLEEICDGSYTGLREDVNDIVDPTTTTTTAPPAGTMDNPIPLGTPIPGDDWTFTVVGFEGGAGGIVQDANQFNEQAPEGSQWVRMRIRATYDGQGSGSPRFALRFSLVGQSGATYDEGLVGLRSLRRRSRPAERQAGTSPWEVVTDLDQVDVYLTILDPSCGGGLTVQRSDRVAIFLDRRLTSRQRRAALAHELTHLRAETAAWLVPRDLLLAWAATAGDVVPIGAREVGERFDVPIDDALEALRQVA